MRIFSFVLFLAAAPTAFGYEGVRREEVDAGVHVPVLTKPPELLEFVQAEYPADAFDAGMAGEVTLLVTIGADGSVVDAVVTQPAGQGFDEAAVAAVKRFRFSPAEVDGQPAPVQIEYRYRFVQRQVPVPDAGTPKSMLLGEVIVRGSRTRIQGATAKCLEEPNGAEAITGPDGRFTLEVEAPECELVIVAPNSHRFKTTEAIAPGESLQAVYHLMPRAVGYETVVRGAREKREVVRRTLERQELQKIPGSFGDPIRVLQNFPGVARAPLAAGFLIVRGAAPNQTKTFFDGVEVPLLFHLGGGPSVVNPEFVDSIDFFPGGFGGRYGRAIGGVVDVATRKGAKDTWHGVADVDFFDASAFLESPLAEGVSGAVAARRSYVDALLPLVLPQDPEGGTLLVLPRYWDYQVRVDWEKKGNVEGSRQTASLMAFGSDDSLEVVSTGAGQARDFSVNVHTLFHRVRADYSVAKGPWSNVVLPYFGYDLGSGDFGSTTFQADIFTLGVRDDFALVVSPTFTARAGLDLMFEHLKGRAELPFISGIQFVPFPGAEPRIETQTIERALNAFDAAVYLEADLKLGPVVLTPGLRATAARIYGQAKSAIEPRLWTSFQPTDDTQLKASVGLYQQPPEGSDLEPAPFGNPRLGFEKALQFSAGIEHRLSSHVNFDLTGFFNRQFDVILTSPRGTADFLRNDGLGRTYGLELMLRHEVTENFFGFLSYTLSRSESKRSSAEQYRLTTYDQTHILTAVASHRLPLGFELGGRFRLVTGRPRTAVTHPYDIYSADSNSYFPTAGPSNEARFPMFHQLDIRLDRHFVYRDWTLSVYLDVQNVYNAQNTEFFMTDYRFRVEIPVPGIPFLPVLGVRGAF